MHLIRETETCVRKKAGDLSCLFHQCATLVVCGWLLLSCQDVRLASVSRLQVERKPSDALVAVGPSWVTDKQLELFKNSAEEQGSRQKVIRDRLLALSLRDRHPSQARVIERSVLARSYFQYQLDRMEQQGDPSADEREQVTQQLQNELNRPKLVRTAEVLIPVPLLSAGAEERALAIEILKKSEGAESLESFALAARSVESALDYELYAVAPVSESGEIRRLVPTDYKLGRVSLAYAAAVAHCKPEQVLDEIVQDKSGFHVVYCVAISEPLERPREQQAELKKRHLASLRAGLTVSQWMQDVRKREVIKVSPQIQSLTRLAWEDRVSK